MKRDPLFEKLEVLGFDDNAAVKKAIQDGESK